jgi:hypothetical protein
MSQEAHSRQPLGENQMNQQQIVRDILEINRRVCFNLWNVADVNSRLEGLSPRLILPQRRSGQIRISEHKGGRP